MSEESSTPTKAKTPRLQAMAAGSQRNAEGIGAAGAVIFAWALSTFSGVDMGPEVTIAVGTVIGAIAARIKG